MQYQLRMSKITSSPPVQSVRTVYMYISTCSVTQYSSIQHTLPFQFPSISVFKDILTCDASNIPAYPWLSKLIIQELNKGRYSPQMKIHSPENFRKYRPWLQTQQNFHACSSCKTCMNPRPCSRKPQPSNLEPK